MRARFWRRLRAACALLASLGLIACTTVREPAFDKAIGVELTKLTRETSLLFRTFSASNPGDFSTRARRYDELAARAETVRLLSEARSGGAQATSGTALGLDRLIGAGAGAAQRVTENTVQRLGPDYAKRLEEYRDATAAYMKDYRRNLNLLETYDRGAVGGNDGAIARYEADLAAHERAVEGYLAAFRDWQAGHGSRPQPPGAAPVAPETGLNSTRVELRRVAMEDILRDALIYERDILNRNR